MRVTVVAVMVQVSQADDRLAEASSIRVSPRQSKLLLGQVCLTHTHTQPHHTQACHDINQSLMWLCVCVCVCAYVCVCV